MEPPGSAPLSSNERGLGALVWEDRLALEQALATSDARYAPRRDEGGLVLGPPGAMVATITARGAHLSLGSEAIELSVAAIGRSARVAVERTADPRTSGAEVRTDRGAGVVEWWRSLPSGLEHGVTLGRRPEGEGELSIAVEVRGDLVPHRLSSDAVELCAASGARVATYAHLVVLDAAGTRLPARMEVEGGRIVLAVDDAGARYPLVVDPLVTAEEAALIAVDGSTDDRFGDSVALSSDGMRALVGAPLDDTSRGGDAGSVRVFRRIGPMWMLEATLLAADGQSFDALGSSVALSSDGSRALIGVPRASIPAAPSSGSARIFFRTGTTWTQEAILIAPDRASGDGLGQSVALSADGTRAILGAPGDDVPSAAGVGSARVFLRTGTTWTQEATLLAADGASNDALGSSVSLSSDGSLALVGVSRDDTAGGNDAGSARVFSRAGTTWTEEATLLAPDAAVGDQLGYAVALSADGARALVGVRFDDTAAGIDAGSARVFLRAGASWSHEAMLLSSAGAANDGFGASVALSPDGSRALVGVTGDDAAGTDAGSARVFFRSGATWAEEATLLAPDTAPGDGLGQSVALLADGTRAIVGAVRDDTGRGLDTGSARVFTLALAPTGSSCGTDAACVSGFCTDGVCCASRCGGGPSDCQACDAASTGGADGVCATLSSAVAPSVICRAPNGACDVPETCTSTSTSCPADLLASAATACRAPSGDCDAPETCTGSSPDCPADGLSTSDTVCRSAVGGCDVAETCTGTSVDCPPDAIAPSGATCRAAAAGCDVAEVCDGIRTSCPGDLFASEGTVCRSVLGACDVEERCPGGSAFCPVDAVVAVGVPCRPALSGCDLAEACTGLGAACPDDLFAPATTACGSAPSDVCDAPDHCTGTSADCEFVYLSGVPCRASSGGCDRAEVCSGREAGCPPDGVSPSGTICRASTEASCDPLESCDGLATSCPTDVTRCAERPDVGPVDAAPSDAAGPSPPTEGCACHAGAGRPFAFVLGIPLLLAIVTRRVRASRSGPPCGVRAVR